MKITITTDHPDIATAITGVLDGIVAAARANNIEGNFNDALLSYEMDFGKTRAAGASERKGTSLGARVQYSAVLPTLRADATKVIEENLATLKPGTQYGTVYRHVVNATMEGRMVTKPEVMKACGIETDSSAERVLGRLAKQGLLISIPIARG